MSANAQSKPIAERELTFMRIFDAPRELVFKLWTDPKHMAQWWGPRGFTNPVCALDARPGGAILIHMRAPNGDTHPMTGTFDTIVEPELLVVTAVARDLDGNPLLEAITTVTFEQQGGKTKLTLHAKAVGIAPIASQMLAGMEPGWTQSLEKLEELVGRTRGQAG